MVITVKRHGHGERFDSRKLYASVYAAALNAHRSEEEAEKLAEHITGAIEHEINNKESINSEQLRNKVIDHLNSDSEVQLMYKHHMDLC